MSEDLLTPQEIADKLGVKISTIYYWSHTDSIPRIKLGHLLRFRWSSISKWLDKKEKKGRKSRKLDVENYL